MKATKNIDIYLIGKRPVKPIDVVQYDTGIQLVFTVKDFTIPSGATATLYVQKPSGKFVYQEKNITIANNTITVDLENQALTEYGRTPYQMTISSGSDTVTSFAGLMIVERSLKDAGAVESATVIKAFDEVTADKIAEFQTNAKAIADAVIETIPDDYTELTAKVNESANAIKGKLSGAVVSADDVSPVEHLMNVKVHGKNLLKNTAVTQTIEGVTFTTNSDGSVTANGTAGASAPIRYNLGEAVLTAGEYLISGQSEGVMSSFVMYSDQDGNNHQQHSGQDAKLTLTKTAKINVYFVVMESRTVSNVTVYPMIRLASVLESDYEPYIDPSTAKVTRCGKNLLNHIGASGTNKGVTFTNNGDGSYTVKGTSEGAVGFALTNLTSYPIILHKGTAYTQSVEILKGQKSSALIVPRVIDSEGNISYNFLTDNQTKTCKEHCKIYSYTLYMDGGVTVDFTFRVQLEVGSVASNWEAYKERTEYIPTSEGVVEGVTSLSPNMTLLTDTEGVIVECEYHKDTNKVVQKLADALGITI